MMDKVKLAFKETGEIDLTSSPRSLCSLTMALKIIHFQSLRRRVRKEPRNIVIARELLLERQTVCHNLIQNKFFRDAKKSGRGETEGVS